MNKKVISMALAIFITTLILSSILIPVHAVNIDYNNPDAYIKDSGEDATPLINIGNIVVGVVRAIGIAVGTLILIIVGIKYIMGSVEERAAYKQTMMPYIIGAILLFGGAGVTSIIYNVFLSND